MVQGQYIDKYIILVGPQLKNRRAGVGDDPPVVQRNSLGKARGPLREHDGYGVLFANITGGRQDLPGGIRAKAHPFVTDPVGGGIHPAVEDRAGMGSIFPDRADTDPNVKDNAVPPQGFGKTFLPAGVKKGARAGYFDDIAALLLGDQKIDRNNDHTGGGNTRPHGHPFGAILRPQDHPVALAKPGGQEPPANPAALRREITVGPAGELPLLTGPVQNSGPAAPAFFDPLKPRRKIGPGKIRPIGDIFGT